jgi:hypothetical protein
MKELKDLYKPNWKDMLQNSGSISKNKCVAHDKNGVPEAYKVLS